MTTTYSPFTPLLAQRPGEKLTWNHLCGSAPGLAITHAAAKHDGPLVVITPDTPSATQLEYELRFFIHNSKELAILPYPDWETLPYDIFSPHQDIVSQRLATLYRLPNAKKSIVIAPVSTLMHRLAPKTYLEANSFLLDTGQTINMDHYRSRLETAGYQCVPQVMEHGDFAVRGSILDLYPMGSEQPYRIDLFDEEVESIRTFDPETQRSIAKVAHISLLPAREFPLSKDAISLFRRQYRETFSGDPTQSSIYRDVSNGLAPAGIEYYLPLFFENTVSLFDYLGQNSLILTLGNIHDAAEQFWKESNDRYEQRRHDIQRPVMNPAQLFLPSNELFQAINQFPRIGINDETNVSDKGIHYLSAPPPTLTINARGQQPLSKLLDFIADFEGRILLAAESTGRRETLIDLLADEGLKPQLHHDWQAFLNSDAPLGITVAPLERGLLLSEPSIAIITEPQLFGEHAVQRRRRVSRSRDSENIIKDLSELRTGSPVVHEEHGVGRYIGLQTLCVGDVETEFLTLEYANQDKLYVPVSSLHLISRYTGASPEQAPLHKLGSEQWSKAKRRAAKKASDVAAELLDIYAQRAAHKGHAFSGADSQYKAFAASFPFEETPDQAAAIQDVIADMTREQPMDRLICGDVGFGKTEVALRAAFLATQDNFQVAVLVPTTLLAQQHYQSFSDRFADWPINVEVLSRFRSKKEQDRVLNGLAQGTVDIVIGTHKLIQSNVNYKQLGLVIIDEEHRFGVKQKETFKKLRSNVDVLTLSATPIPRTLNMAVSALRDLSIIATAPSKRLAVKTFVQPWNDASIQEACLREIKRGGQVYFLHNDIDSIERIASQLENLIPEAKIQVGHGQMNERELERIMLDFYHHRFNILVCTTIIETGIDVPTANTIIINRADKLGLAQLYQLRGRVGRSHHRAYAYLITPHKKLLSKDAEKRLNAISAIEELGAGFTLAVHDLEIRGAGELLGDGQSGQMQEIGFSLYMELLDRAVNALKRGDVPSLEAPINSGAEVDLNITALIPEDYLPDVHSRLVLYKRIANARSDNELRELQVEMIDRFGLLPDPIKNLFKITEIKIRAKPLGIKKIDAGERSGRIIFATHDNIEPTTIINLIQSAPQNYRLEGEYKLKFSANMKDIGARFAKLRELLTRLAEK